ncbi:hypothetical protein Ahy_B07g086796 isoform A [Arachis hypogaea]|uniref:Uncharacterized protein n=1 Tax=Arachis hypogaea TaxID=3818 RepID=A0A444YAX3_ARAHY|nr:hypothetical protein Ahy_B07g086796 isoform A [Arachis hypogaea]
MLVIITKLHLKNKQTFLVTKSKSLTPHIQIVLTLRSNHLFLRVFALISLDFNPNLALARSRSRSHSRLILDLALARFSILDLALALARS